MRARIVFSNEAPAARAQREATLQRIAFDSAFDRGRFVADLRRVRGRVTTERGRVPPGSRHLKLDAGGLMDVELLVALGQLESAADPALRTTVTARALARLGRARLACRAGRRLRRAAAGRAAPAPAARSPGGHRVAARPAGAGAQPRHHGRRAGRRARRTHGPHPRDVRRTLRVDRCPMALWTLT